MPATQGVVGYNTYIYIGALEILEPKDITGPQITAEFVDFTHMQSTLGYRERKPTFKSSGQVTFKCNYVHSDSGQTALVAAANANPPTLSTYRLVFPDHTQIDFQAYASIQWSSPMNGPLELNVTLDITGALGVAAPSPSVSNSPSASASTS